MKNQSLAKCAEKIKFHEKSIIFIYRYFKYRFDFRIYNEKETSKNQYCRLGEELSFFLFK